MQKSIAYPICYFHGGYFLWIQVFFLSRKQNPPTNTVTISTSPKNQIWRHNGIIFAEERYCTIWNPSHIKRIIPGQNSKGLLAYTYNLFTSENDSKFQICATKQSTTNGQTKTHEGHTHMFFTNFNIEENFDGHFLQILLQLVFLIHILKPNRYF
jgi:hypothetical protein